MQLIIDIITKREDIFKALVDSEENQSIIGIASEDLGQGMFMTSVREILEEEQDVLIVLNSYDTSGYFLEKNKVHLSGITGRSPFQGSLYQSFSKSIGSSETARQ